MIDRADLGRRCGPRRPEPARGRRTRRCVVGRLAGGRRRARRRGRADAVLAAPEQRADAHRRYRDTVDHTYDITRIESGEDSAAEARGSPSNGDATPEKEARNRAPEAEEPDAGIRRRGIRGLRQSRDYGPRGRNTNSGSPNGPGRLRVPKPTGAGWLTATASSPRSRTPTPARPARTFAPRARRSSCRRWSGSRPPTRTRRLAGLEHMLKGEDRLKEKMRRIPAGNPVLTVSEALDTVARCRAIHLAYSSDATLKAFSPMSIG